ncbi:formyltetrahydrofolate deformylase [Deinococcus proteolyticus MRP]|uniref:Formyltetrahydrofolate deformylase n=1 Tax=Deinococcus proteolyticus (strain ATCC 35074 / DSM 20540 / JCM 6276 / NBRC 101906 / NCIMB 13154 / VKM Ac-1939 / CCM 2703 / MRP) TaxID=693977 RepID=F0RNA9_DEIPM|nr:MULTISPECIES: formyltetrahydrofolate deformylase [Deinococcus]ADY26251.1 formyltetrahydrofolate deformylase [Deinococcus proteolyticus MRP]MCY1702368.1 formyltetrahydrofolate deformylase [Deinococcus sp. SL84]
MSAAVPGSQPFILTLSCMDRPGIVHAVSGAIMGAGGNIIQSQQFGDTDTGLFFMRVEADLPGGEDAFREQMAALAQTFGMTWTLDRQGRPIRTVIMVSKEGHCLSDLLFRQRSRHLPLDIVAVVGNHADLAPLAEFYGVPFVHLPVTPDTKAQAEAALLELVERENVELVVLARYMQILSDTLCGRMSGRIINIHHSFLPSFKGARPYAQAYARGVKLMGATAHYVTADLDEGPIIEQDVTRITHADSVAAMVQQGQDVERRVLAQAVTWHAEHRVLLNGHRTVVFR